jgi:protein TonB
MMRPLEALVFLSLATGLHMGLWSVAPQNLGATAEGGGDAAAVTLAVAMPAQAALARAWQEPPDRAEATTAPPPPAPDTATPPKATADARPALPPVPELTPILPATLPRSEPAPPRAIVAPAPQTAQPAPMGEPPPQMPRPQARPSTPPRPDRAMPDHAEAPPQADRSPPAPPEPEPKPKARAQPAQPAQAARGGGDKAQSAQNAASDRLQAQWGAQIQRKVHRRLIYPRGAQGNGTARVALTVDRAGRLTGLKLVRSSGTAAFDDAALNAVRRAGRFPAAPAELTRASYSFTLSLAFRP